ncbi:hypothetical protein [Bradyrhizobium sp.]|uniref:hypothetical protein n=1 Tax=Bradyrhizobium sp. TaxID=376 RepID=UPI003C559A73
MNKFTVSFDTWREMIDPVEGAPVTAYDAYLIVETPHGNRSSSSKFGRIETRCGAAWRDPHPAPVSCLTFQEKFIGHAALGAGLGKSCARLSTQPRAAASTNGNVRGCNGFS